MTTTTARACAWCAGPIPDRARRDAITCSKPCRQARHRAHAYLSRDAAAEPSRVDARPQTRRLAYADPPYPGKAWYYRDHPDYVGEVDHAQLLRTLATYDGWALSTSARALPEVLALSVAQDLRVRVAAWVRGPRPAERARHALNAWEPVIYVPVEPRSSQPSRRASAVAEHDASRTAAARAEHDASRHTGATRRIDVLTHGVSPLLTLPSRVIGAKPPAFCAWLFDLIGADPGDTLDDLFPGSGIVGQMWTAYQGSKIA